MVERPLITTDRRQADTYSRAISHCRSFIDRYSTSDPIGTMMATQMLASYARIIIDTYEGLEPEDRPSMEILENIEMGILHLAPKGSHFTVNDPDLS